MTTACKGHPWVAASLDLMMFPLRGLRGKVVGEASGKVLEIGVGTGMNFSRYGDIEILHGVEPDPFMLKRAQQRAREVDLTIELVDAGAEDLPWSDNYFDTVVATWVLCTIPEPARALEEMCRVTKPGGRLLYVEHTRSRGPSAQRMQDRLNPLWNRIAGGCNLNRNSVDLIRDSGYEELQVKACGSEDWTLLPVYRGTAIKPA